LTSGIRVVGKWGCYSDSPEAIPPPLEPLPGEWVALEQRDDGWVLELATAKGSIGMLETSSAAARYVLQRLPELKLGPVRAATVVRDAEEHIVTFDDRSWRLTQVNRRLAMEHRAQRWWLEPRTFEEIAAPLSPGDGGECLTTAGSGPTCEDWSYRYGIVWAGDLDSDEEPDFIFEWSSNEVFGLTVGLSRNPPPGAMLRLIAGLDWGCS
jgi:hypothetical protein